MSHLDRKLPEDTPYWKTKPIPVYLQSKLMAYLSWLEKNVRRDVPYIFNPKYFSEDETGYLLEYACGNTTVGEELDRRLRVHKFRVCVRNLSAWVHELFSVCDWEIDRDQIQAEYLKMTN